MKLFHGDCLSILPTLPTGSADLVCADPPYEATRNPWDSVIPFDDMWRELWRVCTGAIVLTAMQPFSSALVMSQVEHFKHEWIWEKNKATGHLNAKKKPMQAHEVALVFCRGSSPYYPIMTDGHRPMNAYTQTSNGQNYGATNRPSGGGSTMRYPRSVQRFDVVNNDDPGKLHPTQKPVDLFAYLIRTYSSAGATVLDFCMGSGTTGVAAAATGREFIGIEENDVFFAAASNRLNSLRIDLTGREVAA